MLINKVNIGHQIYIIEDPYIRICENAKILDSEIVGNLTIDNSSCINRSTVDRYFGLGCFSYVANSEIGKYCTFGARVSVGAFSHPTDWLSIHEIQYRDTSNIYGCTVIKNGVNISPKNKRTIIGNDVWIGDNACVRAGVTLGTGSIVGLGAVVVKDVPNYAIVGGNPARILRYRFPENIIRELLTLKWWELSPIELEGINFSDINAAISFLRNLNGR
jgi:virginiamycin A acetyltransferase